MTKTLSLTISLAIALVGFAAAAVPTQAATRVMSSSLDAFEFRCENHGGIFGSDGASASCQTPTVPVACDFFSATQAMCAWPGIENQIAVTRVIGTLPGGYIASASSDNIGLPAGNGGGKGGGFDGPTDLKAAPNNDPNPGFDGPSDFKMAP